MSFTNDDDNDGLAALFGGITPNGDAPAARGRRAAVPSESSTPPSDPPGGGAPQRPAADPAPPVYPGLAPQAGAVPPAFPAAPQASVPSAPPPQAVPPQAAPPSWESHAAPPSWEPQPAAAPSPHAATAPQSPAPQSPAYDLPAPAAPPSFGAPSPSSGAPGTPPASPAAVQSVIPPAYPGLTPQPPTPPVYPGLEPALGHGTAPASASADIGVGSQPPAAAAPDASRYPGLAPTAPPHPSPAPAYPPTAQYPAGAIPPSAPPASEPSWGSPSAETTGFRDASSAPAFGAPVPSTGFPEGPAGVQPPPAADAPVYGGFEALGLVPSTYEPKPEASSAQPTASVTPPPLTEPAPESAFGLRAEPDLAGDAPAPSPVRTEGVTPSAEPPVRRDESAVPARRPASGALLPTTEPVGEPPEDLEKATTLEKVGLGIAVIGGPIGLGFAIVNAVRGLRRRGWLIGIARASLVVGVLSTIGAAIGGVALWNAWQDQLAHDEVAAASAAFCAAAAETPEIVEPPLLGWPAPGATITESIDSMTAWTARWTELAAQSPDELAAGMQQLADNGQTIVDSVTSARIVDDTGNRALIESVAGRSGVAAWHDTYCAP